MTEFASKWSPAVVFVLYWIGLLAVAHIVGSVVESTLQSIGAPLPIPLAGRLALCFWFGTLGNWIWIRREAKS